MPAAETKKEKELLDIIEGLLKAFDLPELKTKHMHPESNLRLGRLALKKYRRKTC